MCGIHAIISSDSSYQISDDFKRHLCNRGPDHTATVRSHVATADSLFLSFTSTVLALRGDHVAKQPLVDETSESVLCWNGEAWRIQGELVRGNDGEAVLALLSMASRSGDGVLDALRCLEGPFSFIYYDKPARRLYYGRDRLGRRSLLVKPGMPLCLSSIAETPTDEWAEVEADGFYSIQLEETKNAPDLGPTRHDWANDATLVSSIGVFNMIVPVEPFQLYQDSPSVHMLHQHLVESLRLRVLDVPIPPRASATDARVAVLFSGGLDCTVLARLAHDVVPPGQAIDLINVAFENPRIGSHNRDCSQEDLYEMCPDRMTGRNSFTELLQTCPNRPWRFVTVNVPYTETLTHRPEVVRLIHPHNTEMDLSIACALYFAARGEGNSQTQPHADAQPYSTTARVLLSGLGADELFGGYGRHGVAYTHRGYSGLVDELKLDVGRLGKRNLGRDDRAMAHWGREVRFPFLDERLVKWAIETPVCEKCDFENKGGLDPEKRVLRLLARTLRMASVAQEKKRAIQFGARTAKMESGKTKGTTLISG